MRCRCSIDCRDRKIGLFSYLFSPVVMVFVKKKFIHQQLLKSGAVYRYAMMMWIRVRQLEIVSKMNNKNDDMAKRKRNNQEKNN